MSKVRCKFCVNVKDSLCLKKKKQGDFVKVQVNKPRTCEKYEENAVEVFLNYKKKEAEKKRLRNERIKGSA